MKVSEKEITFDVGNVSGPFKLIDGHNYVLHRIEREGKASVYSLIGASAGTSPVLTPYIGETQMEQVLRLRSAPEGPPKDDNGKLWESCPDCDGTGKKADRADTTTGQSFGACKYCGGSGFISPADSEEMEAARDEDRADDLHRRMRPYGGGVRSRFIR